MDRPLVVNASPLILLARIDRLDLLTSLASQLVLPEAVIREIHAGSHRDQTADRIKNHLKPALMDEALAKVGE